ncbi:MAG: hypothetical protein RIM80_08695, partial [Alphaproteobacteria bacterium]
DLKASYMPVVFVAAPTSGFMVVIQQSEGRLTSPFKAEGRRVRHKRNACSRLATAKRRSSFLRKDHAVAQCANQVKRVTITLKFSCILIA